MSLFSFPYCSKRYVMQANNSDDRKAWLEVMEGKEPVYTSLKVLEGMVRIPAFQAQGGSENEMKIRWI